MTWLQCYDKSGLSINVSRKIDTGLQQTAGTYHAPASIAEESAFRDLFERQSGPQTAVELVESQIPNR